jgi:hypothetical protein
MDAAILNAERDAALAAAAAKGAQAKFVEWTTGERQVIDSLKRLGKVIESPAFIDVSKSFIKAHMHAFDFSDENRLEYTALHEKYVELMEKTLVESARDVDVDELVSNLPEFMSGSALERDPEQTGPTIEFLLSLTEFSTFKSMMLAARMESEGLVSTPMVGDLSADHGGAAETLGLLDISDSMRAALAPLLALTTDAHGVSWKKLAEDKGEFVMETAHVGGKSFTRMAMSIDLPVDQAIEVLGDLSNPECVKRFKMMESVDVLHEERTDKKRDMLLRLHLNMPAIMKMLKVTPDTMVVRMHQEFDVPEKGCSTSALVSWDAAADAPDVTSKVRISRLSLARPNGPGKSSITNIEPTAEYMPEWMMGIVASKFFAKQMRVGVQQYKRERQLKEGQK